VGASLIFAVKRQAQAFDLAIFQDVLFDRLLDKAKLSAPFNEEFTAIV
jgi:hypothetical protein